MSDAELALPQTKPSEKPETAPSEIPTDASSGGGGGGGPTNSFKAMFFALCLSLVVGLSVGLGVGLSDKNDGGDAVCPSADPSTTTTTTTVAAPILDDPLPPTETASRYTPAEFDTLEVIYVAWPRYDYVTSLPQVRMVVLEMLLGLCSCQLDTTMTAQQKEDCTDIIVQAPADILDDANTTIFSTPGLEDCPIRFQTSERDDMWIRDMGPVFTKICDGANADRTTTTNCDERVVVDFQFDFWSAVGLGSPDLNHLEATLDQRIYASDFPNLTVTRTNLIGEGGNREFNGQGVLLMNRDVERYRNEKKAWSIERSEEEYKRIFGVDKIVWVDGVPNNDFIAEFPTRGKIDDVETYLFNWGTGGHIDELARFVTPGTIVISQISDAEVEHDTTGVVAKDQAILRNIKEQLEQATDANGQKFKIIEAPAAPLFINEMTADDELWYWFEPLNVFQDTLAAGKKIHTIGATSYMNFLTTNKVVLIPKYFMEGDEVFGLEEIQTADQEFKNIMTSVYPDRKIVAINPLPVNQGGGGMHCISAHQNM